MTLIFLLGINSINAQENISGVELATRYKWKLDCLSGYINTIGSRNVSESYKKEAISSALALFYNEGKPYVEDSIMKEGATIQSVNRYGRRFRPKTIKTYLESVRQLSVEHIRIADECCPTFPDTISIADLKSLGDSIFSFEAYTVIKTRTLKEGGVVYSDYTPTKVNVYLKKMCIDTVDGRETIYTPLLSGNIIIETER